MGRHSRRHGVARSPHGAARRVAPRSRRARHLAIRLPHVDLLPRRQRDQRAGYSGPGGVPLGELRERERAIRRRYAAGRGDPLPAETVARGRHGTLCGVPLLCPCRRAGRRRPGAALLERGRQRGLRVLQVLTMRDFPVHTALAIVTLGALLAVIRPPNTAQLRGLVEFTPELTPLSPIARHVDT